MTREPLSGTKLVLYTTTLAVGMMVVGGVLLQRSNFKATEDNTAQPKQTEVQQEGQTEENSDPAHYPAIKQWVEQSSYLLSRVGTIKKISRKGQPDYRLHCISEKCYATLKLKVKGTKGKGELLLPKVALSARDNSIDRIGEALWIEGDMINRLYSDGKSLAESLGLTSIFETLESQLKAKDIKAALRLIDRHKEDFDKLHPTRRARLYKVILGANDTNPLYSSKLKALRYLLEACSQPKHYFDNREVTPLRETLQQTLRLFPDFSTSALTQTKMRATLEVVTQLHLQLLRLGADAQFLSEVESEWNPQRKALWGEQRLGAFYTAVRLRLGEDPWVQRVLGTPIKVLPSVGNELGIKKGRYFASMNMDLSGPKGKARARVSAIEKCQQVPTLQVLTPEIRPPQLPIIFTRLEIDYLEWGRVKESTSLPDERDRCPR